MASKLAVNLTDDLTIDPPWMNASGILSYPGIAVGLQEVFGAFVLKSTGYEPRDGNETPIYKSTTHYSINSVGLPNPGREGMAQELVKYRGRIKIPIGASVFGSDVGEFAETVKALDPYVDFFELNFSCPNIRRGEKTGMEIGKDPLRARAYVIAARAVTDKPIFAKLSPALHIYDPRAESEVNMISIAETCLENGATGIAAINTIPGAMDIDIHARRPVLTAGYGGLGGRGIKPIGVGAVASLRRRLGNTIPIIGMGGISEWEDVVEYTMAGATAVAIGTELEGPAGLQDTKRERIEKRMGAMRVSIEDFLEREGTTLEDIRGIAVR